MNKTPAACSENPIDEIKQQLKILNERSQMSNLDLSSEIAMLKKELEEAEKNFYANMSPWQRVQLSRHPLRPYSLDYMTRIFSDLQELHGDRVYADDQSMVCGIAEFEGAAVMVIAQQKGRSVKENIFRNFGMQRPEGYRKALRLMKLAERFHMPIVTFVDTSGAFPGVESEERHVARAIAEDLRDMMMIRSPIVSVFIGEGGSGGAIGISVADRVLMLENAYYSVISPEGCAAILWKDKSKAQEAANALKLSAHDLQKFGIVDEVIPEPRGGAHNDYDAMASAVKSCLSKTLNALKKTNIDALVKSRHDRYRNIGDWNKRNTVS